MPLILHILTQPKDALAEEIIARQRERQAPQVSMFDLTAPEPDYRKLLQEIFAADSIVVW